MSQPQDEASDPEGAQGELELSPAEREVLAFLRNSKRVDLRWLSEQEKTKIRDALDGLHNGKKISVLRISKEVGRSYTAIWGLCRALRIQTRNPGEASKESAERRAKHKRNPFDGTEQDRAYMLGFKNGDLTAWQVSGTAVMVTSTTTHPAFAKLFHALFEQHGHVYEYPMHEEGRGYKWKVAVRLDNSFRFLLHSADEAVTSFGGDRRLFLSWLAGLLDADGHINIGEDQGQLRVRLELGSINRSLLNQVKKQLEDFGYFPTGPYLHYESGFTTPIGISYRNDMWTLSIQRTAEAQRLLMELPIKHAEKIQRKELAVSINSETDPFALDARLSQLRSAIHEEVSKFVEQAEVDYKKRERGHSAASSVTDC